MSRTVDNRVIEMGFDNKQFESGVKNSVESLNTLKKGLQLDDASKSLSNLSRAGKSFSLEGIGTGVDNISSKFSAFGVIGFTVMQNLTNSAIDLGRKFVASFTKPMKMGFEEYETQMNAVQTVLANTASKGTTLDDVNKALDTLNTYADKTIYNFTEMTKNIGTFTAAGITLETSVEAIKGIANLAAVSGSTSQQASTAMYQLSQALSSGTVKLMDWNSVVNAGMGGQVFQDALKETARLHGVSIDKMMDQEGSFRETLKHGWLTSEVLTETLAKFTGDLNAEQLKAKGYTEEQIEAIVKLGQTANDAATKVKTFTQLKETLAEALQSGWTRTWQLIIGDFEEAKAFFTEISDILGAMIGESSDARNKIVESWSKYGGRDILIDSLRNSFEAFLKISEPIKEAFKSIFGPGISGMDLARLTTNIRKFTKGLIISSDTAEKIKRIFKGFFAILDIGRLFVSSLASKFAELFKYIAPASGGILDFLANIGDWAVNLRDAIKINDTFNVTLKRIGEFVVRTKQKIVDFVDAIKEKFPGLGEKVSNFFKIFKSADTSGAGKFLDKMKERLAPLKGLGDIIATFVSKFVEMGMVVAPKLMAIRTAIGDFIKNIGKRIMEGIENISFDKTFDTINAGLIAALLLAVRSFINQGGGAFKGVSGIFESISGVFNGVTGVLNGVRGSLETWQQTLKSKVLLTIAFAIGILTLSLIALSLLDSEKLAVSLGTVTAMMVQLMGSLALYSKLAGSVGGLGFSVAILGLASAILILAVAFTIISRLSLEEIGKGLAFLAGVLLILGIAGYALTPVIPVLSGLAIAMFLMGVSAAAVGIGMLAFAAGIASLALVGKKGAETVVEMIRIFIEVMPEIVTALVDSLVLFGVLIAKAAPEIGAAIKALLLMVVDIIIALTPKLVKSLSVLLKSLIQLLRDVIPDFVGAIIHLLSELLKSLAEKMPEFVQSGMDIIISILKGIRDNIGEIVTVAIEIVTEFINAVAEKIPDVIDSGFNLIVSFIDGLADAVEENSGTLFAAVGRLATAIVTGLTDGLTAGVGGVISAIGKLGGAAINALKTLLGIFSPSKVFTSLGEFAGEGFINGILVMVNDVKKAANVLGDKAVSGMSDAISYINNSLNDNIDINPTIRPVIDLTDVISGANNIENIIKRGKFGVVSNITKIPNISDNMKDRFDGNDGKIIPGISLTQYNYSPKALSRLEIYRQTKNQLSTLKGLVST